MPEEKSLKKTRSPDSIGNTFLVAIVLCLVCSVLVSSAAVLLKPIQERNKVLDRKKNILRAAGLLTTDADIEALFKQIESQVINLATGKVDEGVDPKTFDARKAADDPAQSVAIPTDQDFAKIKRRAKDSLIYLVKDGERIKSIILPIHGRGLYSTLYGFIALRSDGRTIEGLSYYEHGETPGLGGEVDNPRWREKWVGKRIYDDNGELKFQVVKGGVDTSRPEAQYQVDAIAGATLTSRGVNNMMHYWFSEAGYLPLLRRLTPLDS